MKYVACDYFEQLQSPIVASSSFLPCQTASETRILQHLNPVLKASPSLQLASQDLIRIAVGWKRIAVDRKPHRDGSGAAPARILQRLAEARVVSSATQIEQLALPSGEIGNLDPQSSA